MFRHTCGRRPGRSRVWPQNRRWRRGLELAERRSRRYAFLIDLVLYSLLLFLVPIFRDETIHDLRDHTGEYRWWGPVLQLWVLLNIAWFPLWLYWASKGWSPGKLAVGIRVVTMEGRQPGWRKAIVREVGKLLGGHDNRAGTIVVTAQTEDLIPEDLELASPEQRLGAFAIDFIIFIVVMSIAAGAHAAYQVLIDDGWVDRETAAFWVVMFLVMVSYVAFSVYATGNGWSPGKLALKVRVVTIDGQPPGWEKALGRELVGKFLSLVLLLGFLPIVRDPRRQGWHDKIEETIVVTKR